jgi:hypothetical protein
VPACTLQLLSAFPPTDLASDLGPLLEYFTFAAGDKRSTRAVNTSSDRSTSGSALELAEVLDPNVPEPAEATGSRDAPAPQDGTGSTDARSEAEPSPAGPQTDPSDEEHRAHDQVEVQPYAEPRAFEQPPPGQTPGEESRSESGHATHCSVAGRADAARTTNAPSQAESNRDFWAEVVDVHEALLRHGGLAPNEALNSAIAWVTVAALVPEPSKVNVGLPRATQSSGSLGSLVAPAAPMAVASRGAAGDIARWASDLRADLSGQATRALVAAWEQRGSALSAARGAKG